MSNAFARMRRSQRVSARPLDNFLAVFCSWHGARRPVDWRLSKLAILSNAVSGSVSSPAPLVLIRALPAYSARRLENRLRPSSIVALVATISTSPAARVLVLGRAAISPARLILPRVIDALEAAQRLARRRYTSSPEHSARPYGQVLQRRSRPSAPPTYQEDGRVRSLRHLD